MATVLILEDDPVLVDLLKTIVEEGGHEAVVAPTIERVPPRLAPDLVLTDLIPLTSYRREQAEGWVRNVRARFPRATVIVLTAHAAAAREADQLGADDVIANPFDVDALARKISERLTG